LKNAARFLGISRKFLHLQLFEHARRYLRFLFGFQLEVGIFAKYLAVEESLQHDCELGIPVASRHFRADRTEDYQEKVWGRCTLFENLLTWLVNGNCGCVYQIVALLVAELAKPLNFV